MPGDQALVTASSHPLPAAEQTDLRSRLSVGLEWAGRRAYAPGEYVGQECFVMAGEAVALVSAAGVSRGSRLLDMCCGMGGMGLHLVERLGCELVGMDHSAYALDLAVSAARKRSLGCQTNYLVGDANAVPLAGGFDAVLLLEVQMAFQEKAPLVQEVHRLLRPGGRLAITFEDAEPLTQREQRSIPDGHTVWLTPAAEFISILNANGLRVLERYDRTAAQFESICRLRAVFRQNSTVLANLFGLQLYRDLSAAYEQWHGWLENGRVRSIALVAERIERCGILVARD